jgi:hypothetical protein
MRPPFSSICALCGGSSFPAGKVPLLRKISNSRARATRSKNTYCCSLETCSQGDVPSAWGATHVVQYILLS